MKILSKTVIASILSTLVAASVMAQCPHGGCPWGSYNRNYDRGPLQGQSEWNNSNQYRSGYRSQGPQYYESNQGSYQTQRQYPYPYGAQTYYNDFDEHGMQPGMQHAGMQQQSGYYSDGTPVQGDASNLQVHQESQATSTWSTTSANPNANNAQSSSGWGWGTSSNANNAPNAEQTRGNAGTNNQNLNAPRR